jgi:hypothetical protein
MPKGPMFDTTPVGSPVQVCRQTNKKGKGWDMPCLLKILCKGDSDVIKHVQSKVELYKVDRVFFEDDYFDGKKWTQKLFEAGGTMGQKEMTFLSNTSCASAATTIYHETWHAKQPTGMGWPHPAEDDAYYNTELWTIARGLPSQGGSPPLRTRDSKGKIVPDKAAIAKNVDNAYPVQPPAPPGWRRTGFDKTKRETLWYDGASKTKVWKASKVGETFPGPQQTVNKTLIPAKAIKCP